MAFIASKNIDYKLYYNFKAEIHMENPRAWIITDNDGEVEILGKWSNSWGAKGYTYWQDPNWSKTGMVSFFSATVRYPKAGPPSYERVGPDNRLLAFHKYYDPVTGEFRYYQKNYPIDPQTKLVSIEFNETDRVIKNRETGFWDYLDPNRKNHWKEELDKYYAYAHYSKKKK